VKIYCYIDIYNLAYACATYLPHWKYPKSWDENHGTGLKDP
jgi:hypothetical protein